MIDGADSRSFYARTVDLHRIYSSSLYRIQLSLDCMNHALIKDQQMNRDLLTIAVLLVYLRYRRIL